MWWRKRHQPEPEPRKSPITASAIPMIEVVEGWGQNPINIMPNWDEVRRNAALSLAENTTKGFIMFRVRNSDLPGGQDRVVLDACVMPYQRESLKDACESLWNQL